MSATIRRDDIKGFENPITSKINEWKEIVKNPLKPFEDNFDGVLSDVSSITKDLRQSDHSELADGIDRFVVNSGKEYWHSKHAVVDSVKDLDIGNINLYYEGDKKALNTASLLGKNKGTLLLNHNLTVLTPEGLEETSQYESELIQKAIFSNNESLDVALYQGDNIDGIVGEYQAGHYKENGDNKILWKK